MGVNIQNTLDDWMSKREIDLISNYNKLGLRASGEFERGIRIQAGNNSSAMYAPYHAWFMVNGRLPNTSQDEKAIKGFARWAGATFLADWVERKGIKISPYAIGYSIARKGIKVPNANNTGTLLTDTFTDKTYDDLYNSLMFLYIAEFKSTIQKTWQQ